MITLQEAKELAQGQTIYHCTMTNADNTPVRFRVSSVKTWKRDPNRLKVGLKHGLYSYGVMTNGVLKAAGTSG